MFLDCKKCNKKSPKTFLGDCNLTAMCPAKLTYILRFLAFLLRALGEFIFLFRLKIQWKYIVYMPLVKSSQNLTFRSSGMVVRSRILEDYS